MILQSGSIQSPGVPEVPVEVVKDVAKDYFLGLDPTSLKWLAGLVGFLVLMWLGRKVRRLLRRRRPPRLHPHLQKYGDGATESTAPLDLPARRHAEAARILATSSTAEITGYEIVEQIEAVYVDGFRKPEEALEGLKAVAGMKGANAVIRVRQERNAGGRCTASGDAVIVRRVGAERVPATGPTPGISPDGMNRPEQA